MKWHEILPNGCPPLSASSTKDKVVFRIAEYSPPQPYDFLSHREKHPTKYFKVDECQARSLSVFDDYDAVVNVTKMPLFKNKKVYILKLNLLERDGLILQTSGKNHFSWWRSALFEIPERII